MDIPIGDKPGNALIRPGADSISAAHIASAKPTADELGPILTEKGDSWGQSSGARHLADAQDLVLRLASEPSPATFWLILEHRDVDVCLKDPGFAIDS